MSSGAQPTVVLTGGTGFLGSRLVHAFRQHGIPTILLKRRTSDTWRIASVLSDVRAYDLETTPLDDVFAQTPVDLVVHVATSYGRQGEHASDVVEANVGFPLRLLEAATRAGVRLFLNADTFSTKGDGLPKGLEAYTMTKRAFRELGTHIASGSGLSFVTMQIEHMYGPHDNATKFIPWLIQTMLTDHGTCELTAGGQQRDFVHVDDVVRAFLTVIDQRARLAPTSSLIEVGTGRATSLRAMVELLHTLTGSRTELVFGALPYRTGESPASWADTSALRALGWLPVTELRDGLAETIHVHRQDVGHMRVAR